MDYYLSKLPGKFSFFIYPSIYLLNWIGFGKYVGPRYFQIGKNLYVIWTITCSFLHDFSFSAPSLALFGASVFAYLLYITDWKVTNTKIPIYGRKFEEMKRAGLIDRHGQKAVDEGTASDD